MQQTAEWLEKHGMSEYPERFARNDTDVSVLRHLTDRDLKELGVSTVLQEERRSRAQISRRLWQSQGPAEDLNSRWRNNGPNGPGR
jgi:SAM domain (Sterile alpha motif)